jgi:hypothetical protein
MDDRTDLTGEGVAATRTAFGRREMLQRTGFVVGAAALWNAPIVKSISLSAAAATPVSDFCPEIPSPVPEFLVWKYVGGSCADSANSQSDEFFSCSGDTGNEGCVDIVVTQTGLPGGSATATLTGVALNGVNVIQLPSSAGRIGTNTTFSIRKLDGTVLQTVRMHTSCSAPLDIGDRYGSMLLVGGKEQDKAAVGDTTGTGFEPSGTTVVDDCP